MGDLLLGGLCNSCDRISPLQIAAPCPARAASASLWGVATALARHLTTTVGWEAWVGDALVEISFQAANLHPTRRILRREASRGGMTLSVSGFILLVLKYGGFPCREFARWKVNNLALERKDFFSLPLPLAPEFVRNIRLLGRRPNLQQVTENLIKKYGTHFLLSATLGGKQRSRPQPTGSSTAENSFYDLLNVILPASFLPFWLIIAWELLSSWCIGEQCILCTRNHPRTFLYSWKCHHEGRGVRGKEGDGRAHTGVYEASPSRGRSYFYFD